MDEGAPEMSHLFCFGLGYSANALALRLKGEGWRISGTSMTSDGARRLREAGYEAHVFNGATSCQSARPAIAEATHFLVSAPPDALGDPVLRLHAQDISSAPHVRWIGYLSTIGVYGDHGGAWVDEDTPAHPTNERSRRRLAAEQAWLKLAAASSTQLQIFRLAGIYGPGRSAIDAIRSGTARRIVKPNQVFNRIHVDDIASVLRAATTGRGRHDVYNVTDNEPAPPQDVIAFAARLLDQPPPPEVAYERAGLTEMAATFYAENKRVRNVRLGADLGVALAYPTYREGLRAILAAG
jgi:nucleoside-diphosphate-sugar epimerase